MTDSTGSCSLVRTGYCTPLRARPGINGLGVGALPVTSLSIAKKKSLSLFSLKARREA